MTPERKAELEQLEKALAPFASAAFQRGTIEGEKVGYLYAVQDLEAEVARIADAGRLQEMADLAGALAKAAGWLRRKHASEQ